MDNRVQRESFSRFSKRSNTGRTYGGKGRKLYFSTEYQIWKLRVVGDIYPLAHHLWTQTMVVCQICGRVQMDWILTASDRNDDKYSDGYTNFEK